MGKYKTLENNLVDGYNKRTYTRREFLKKSCNVGIGIAASSIFGGLATLVSSSCKTPTTPEPPDPDDVIVNSEDVGVDTMVDKCRSYNLNITLPNSVPPEKNFYVLYNGNMVQIYPDFFIGKPNDPTNNPYYAFGEFVSASDGLTPEQETAISYYNSLPGLQGKGKTLIARSGMTKKEIKNSVESQLRDWGFI